MTTSNQKSHHNITIMNYDIENNDCWIAGMEYLNKPPTTVTDYKLSSFVSTFGTPPSVCLVLWNLTETARHNMRRSTRHVHLLMALYLLKNYSRSRASAGAFGVHTDTWKYYTDRLFKLFLLFRPPWYVKSHSSLCPLWKIILVCLNHLRVFIFILDLLDG